MIDRLLRLFHSRAPNTGAADVRCVARDVRGIATGVACLRSLAPPSSAADDDEPIFLLAAGWRSGSTLLQRCIMSDAGVLMWGEPYHECGVVQALAECTRAFRADWPKAKWFYRGTPPAALATTWIANLFPAPDDWRLAQRALFDTAFAEPARRSGAVRWGIKEVRWTSDDARYLRWLYPRSRLVFLYRDPWQAYRSYRRRGGDWYDTYPDRPVFNATQFGHHWQMLTTGFLRDADELGALVLRFEEVAETRDWIARLERHLEIQIDPAVLDVTLDGADAGVPQLVLDDRERQLLTEAVGPLAQTLGYSG